MPATMSKSPRTTAAAKDNTITVRKAAPSKPGEKVDIGAADIVSITAAKITQDGKATTAAVKAGKLTAAEKKRSATKAGAGYPRLTMEWTGADKKDVAVKDEVKLPNGAVISCVGRWSKRKSDGTIVPMITGRIVSGAPDGKSKGDRLNAVAGECTHVKA